MKLERPKLTLAERLYVPAIVSGLALTFSHIFRKKVTLQYPEEKPEIPPGYRGQPVLVKDEEGRVKCVACQLCEFVCPPRAITIKPMEYPADAKYGKVEKTPAEFDIDMLRCIYCGYCEEACPEQAIFLRGPYTLNGLSRKSMVFNKDRLLELGGTLPDPIKKWQKK
ncbi:MAG: NADH-quinone oxidoreductase subunit I [Verrucomicrobia bacterium]|nr:NADH-quinone oxidoreductase subunit I [Verrucomicrobiota bacterium]